MQGDNKYLLDGICHRMKLSDRWAYIKQFKRKWEGHPGVQRVRIGYERYGQQVDVEVIHDMMQRENNYFEIEELNTPRKGRHAKADRISRLEPDIREGRFYLPARPITVNSASRATTSATGRSGPKSTTSARRPWSSSTPTTSAKSPTAQ